MARDFGRVNKDTSVVPAVDTNAEPKATEEVSAPTSVAKEVNPAGLDIAKIVSEYENSQGIDTDGEQVQENPFKVTRIPPDPKETSSATTSTTPTPPSRMMTENDEILFNRFQAGLLGGDQSCLDMLSKSPSEIMAIDPDLGRAINACFNNGMKLTTPSTDMEFLENVHSFTSLMSGDIAGAAIGGVVEEDENKSASTTVTGSQKSSGPSSSPSPDHSTHFSAESSAAAAALLAGADQSEESTSQFAGRPSVLAPLGMLFRAPKKVVETQVTKSAVRALSGAAKEYDANPSDETFKRYSESTAKLAKVLTAQGKNAAALKILENGMQDIEKAPVSEEAKKALADAMNKLIEAIRSIMDMIFSRKNPAQGPQLTPRP